jgi:hypothetical protein
LLRCRVAVDLFQSRALRENMQIYLPIAEVSVNAFLLLGLGGIVGILSGMFGVGGGFLMTPLLFFIGIPPAVAVATEANQIVASSFSGVLAHLRRKTVDLRMGTVLLIGGLAGAALGVVIFNYLKAQGQHWVWWCSTISNPSVRSIFWSSSVTWSSLASLAH